MTRTRSKGAPKALPSKEPIESTKEPIPASVCNPPKLFVLPKDTSKDARIVTFDNPANGEPSRYYFCPEKGFYEFTRIAAPKKECRSWLITGDESVDSQEEKKEADSQEGTTIGSGYVTKDADLFIATPIDLLFLLLPALAPKNTKGTKQLFLAFDDHLDTLSSSSRHWKVLLAQYPTLKVMVEKKMKVLCDSVDAGDETMYRISNEKLLAALLKKAERMCKNGLPPSMEEKLVKPALDVPIMNIKREDSSLSAVSTMETTPPEHSQTSETTPAASTESQSSAAISADTQTSTDSISTAATSITVEEEVPSKPALETPPEVPHLLRLRTCITYLTSSYLPTTYRTTITTLLADPSSPINFTPLNTHLFAIAKLKAEAAALRSISDNISRKRNFEDDDEKAAEREEKKRKKEEEERKKKSESRGIKQLKKVDTSGMKKMSAFFTKAPKKA